MCKVFSLKMFQQKTNTRFDLICTLSCVYLDTHSVFSTKTQHFTPKFLKSVVEVHLFLKGSELSKYKNTESPNFKHFHPETSMGKLLKV